MESVRGDCYRATMTKAALRKAVENEPFRPFTVRLANGAQIQVASQERIAIHPDGKTFVIFESDGGYRIVDIPLVTELSVK
jgi:hypothetical protein